MCNFLAKIFIKNYKDTNDPTVRRKYGTMGSIVGICVNFLLFSFKLLAGLISASVAIIADAINNLSDAGSSVVSLVSFKLASKPADKDHPFGHARIEYIASMIVAFLILSVGFGFLTDSLEKIFADEKAIVTVEAITVIILSVSIAFKLLLSMFYRSLGNKIDSSVMKANSLDSLLDALSTSAVLISSIIVKYTEFYLLDLIVGLAVSFMIIVAGVRIINETKNSLLGEGPQEELIAEITEITDRYPEIIGIHDMLVHNYGPGHSFASFHAEVNGKDDIFLLHDAIDNAEREINERLGIHCSIHLDPVVTDDEEINKMKRIAEQALASVSPLLSLHDFRVVIGATHSNMIFDVVIPFDYKDDQETVIKAIQANVTEINPCYYCVITVDRG